MVEDVEKFHAKVEGVVFVNYGSLRKAEVGVVETGTMEEAAVRRAKSPESGVRSKRAGQEVASRIAAGIGIKTIWVRLTRINNLHRTDLIRHIRATTAGERNIVIGLVHLNGEPGGKARDALHLPTLCQAFRRPLKGSIK